MQPRRDIALAMEDAPDVDVVRTIQIEDEIGKALQRPKAQLRQLKLVGVPKGTRCGVSRQVVKGFLQRANKRQRRRFTGFPAIVVDGIVNVGQCAATRDNGLDVHLASARYLDLGRARRRSPAKKALFTGCPGAEVAPSSSIPRRRWRSWSFRISSRTYSLLVPYPRVVTCSSTKDLSPSGNEMFIVLMRL